MMAGMRWSTSSAEHRLSNVCHGVVGEQGGQARRVRRSTPVIVLRVSTKAHVYRRTSTMTAPSSRSDVSVPKDSGARHVS